MMLASQFPRAQLKHLRKQIISRALSFSSSHSGVQKSRDEKTVESNAHSIIQRKPLTEQGIEEIINIDNIHLQTKFQKRLAERAPLVKNFFLGKVDAELMAYPQVIDIVSYEKLVETLRPVHEYFEEKSKKYFDADRRDISNELITELKRMNIFGRTVPELFGGIGYFNSEANLVSECESVDVKFAEIIASHRMATEAISAHGTAEQKEKYLYDLAKGNLIGCVCPYDPQSEPLGRITAVPDVSTNSSEWILNGSQSFVVRSKHSNLLIVTAIAEEESENNDKAVTKKSITFVLDTMTHGVTFNEISDTIGCREVPYVTVDFSNVRLSAESILSETHGNRSAAEQLIYSSRMQTAIMNTIQTKQVLNHLIKHVIDSSFNGEKLMDMEMFRHKLVPLASELYALESMIHLTAGIEDSYVNPKTDLESAIVKSFSLDIMSRVVQLLLDYPASAFLIKGNPSEEYIRNAIQLRFSKESTDKLKSNIGLAGLQHCHNITGDKVKNHSDSLINKLLKGRSIENVHCDLHLEQFVHPSLENSIILVETSILRMHVATEMLLHRYGTNADERHMDLRKLGEGAIWNYAMFASVSRASRAYCNGLRFSVYETVIATSLVESNENRVLDLMLAIKNAPKTDDKYQQMGKLIEKGQFRWPSIVLKKVLEK